MTNNQNSAVPDIPIILFDGVCNLCERTVHFVVRRDRDRQFRFASLQSEVAQQMLASHQYAFDPLSSVLLIVDDKMYRKSGAALQIVRRLDGAWSVFYYLFFWVPKFIADPAYDFIANRRYKWFGKKSECWVPDDDLRQHFLDY